MKKTEKLKNLAEKLQPFVDEFKYSEVKPVYYYNWVKRLVYIKLQLIRSSKK
ncbi:hypothetical protein MKJ01_05610 [Chryseobacterium sp. SSA4.19]|uniref:hypothetical protein n=1 Tax=Chryseobacterium sp. SSA4.19 TaxID=2919915 RepID=UPI001F4DDC73|nr:hypothetical protein [Chryseobacterium sp. SSA4.19]MCJ8153237.1 hypothetical protein [Chryseobacterium sp. SSA4.19]